MTVLQDFHGIYGGRAIDARNYSSLSALVVLVLDYLLSCRSEYRYIWQAKFRLPQALYLVSRYFALTLQIVHYSFVHMYLVHGPVSITTCRIWFSMLGMGSIIIGICMNLILLLRLYALYMKNSKILALAVPIVGQHVIALVVIGRAILQDNAFSEKCDLHRTPIEAAPLGVITIVSQAALWLAAFNKRKISHAAVLSLVVRESHLTLAILAILSAVMIPYSFVTHSANPFIIFVWPITCISVTSCRLVLSMHQLKWEGSRGESVTEYIFTSIVNSSQISRDSTQSSGIVSIPSSLSSTQSFHELSSRLECN